ncbi:MAG: NUDIX hydrolase [Syntrophomonadaceae bacterium]|nr:NUDIX hydrolase [Syntrophomonadaceae bacterium]
MRNYIYCPYCANKLATDIIDNKTRQVCYQCNFIHYQNPLPTTVCIGELDDKVLLIKRGIKPRKGEWTLPSGFVELGETAEESCLRELAEETGMTGEVANLIGVYHAYSEVYGDIISTIYHIRLKSGIPIAGDDAEDVKLVPINEIGDLHFAAFNQAFDKFKKIIK